MSSLSKVNTTGTRPLVDVLVSCIIALLVVLTGGSITFTQSAGRFPALGGFGGLTKDVECGYA